MVGEKQFEKQVKGWLNNLKQEGHPIKFIKIWGGGFQKAGIPDILACVNGHFVAIELKGTNGKPTKLQEYNIRKINECNGVGIILYPKDFERFKKLILDLLRR